MVEVTGQKAVGSPPRELALEEAQSAEEEDEEDADEESEAQDGLVQLYPEQQAALCTRDDETIEETC